MQMDDHGVDADDIMLYCIWKQASGDPVPRVLARGTVPCLGRNILATGCCGPKLARAEERAGLVHGAPV